MYRICKRDQRDQRDQHVHKMSLRRRHCWSHIVTEESGIRFDLTHVAYAVTTANAETPGDHEQDMNTISLVRYGVERGGVVCTAWGECYGGSYKLQLHGLWASEDNDFDAVPFSNYKQVSLERLYRTLCKK